MSLPKATQNYDCLKTKICVAITSEPRPYRTKGIHVASSELQSHCAATSLRVSQILQQIPVSTGTHFIQRPSFLDFPAGVSETLGTNITELKHEI